MDAETKKKFDATLNLALKTFYFDALNLVAAKRKLTISISDVNCAEVSFDYLTKAGGIYVLLRVFGGDSHDTLTELKLTSPRVLMSQDTMLISSLSELRKEFSDDPGGVVRIYSAMDFELMCQQILARLSKFHLVKVRNFLLLSVDVVEDILRYPLFYTYPAATAALAFKKNGLGLVEFQAFEREVKKQKFFGFTAQSFLEAKQKILEH